MITEFLNGQNVRVLYSANSPEIVGKIGRIVSSGSLICDEYWYYVQINGKRYNCCSGQLTYA
jgi:hypothetical protein